MMHPTADKLSRIAALRPASARGLQTATARRSGSDQLNRLVGGESVRNRFGEHVRVRRKLFHPKAEEMSSEALRLIAPGSVDVLCDLSKWLFLDTETTGLAGGTGTYAFLIGLAWLELDGFVVEQHFMREHSEEPSLLLDVAEHLEHRRVLVTFNGKSFDWPLLKTRFQMARIGRVSEPEAHLDLLHPARRLWKPDLPSVALAQLERHVLQLDRGPDIPSSTIPQRFFDFLRGGSPEPVAEIFQHNQMDLSGLALLAQHMNGVLRDPENGSSRAGELLGISRLLQLRRKDHLAGRMYQKALDAGLPAAAEQTARRELALLAKKAKNYELSNALWEKLLDISAGGLRAYEELAIYYEHRTDRPEKAAELAHEALIRLQEAFHDGRIPVSQYRQWNENLHHRLTRLKAKAAKA